MTRPSQSSGILLALAVAAGVVDAASYLGLGRVFTANMTGNTVLLGVAVARGAGGDAARSATALAGFCVGGGAAAALIRPRGAWPARAAAAFGLEGVSLLALGALWAATGAGSTHYFRIALAGIAMGAQSSAVRASDVGGVSTTYMTSTLLNAVARAVTRLRGRNDSAGDPILPGTAWMTYGGGAIGGAFAEKAWHAGVIVIPLAIVCAVAGTALRDTREEHR